MSTTPVGDGVGRSASRGGRVGAALSGAAAAAAVGACSACVGAGSALLAGAGRAGRVGLLGAGVAAVVVVGLGVLRLTGRPGGSPLWCLLTIPAAAYLAGAVVVVPLLGLTAGDPGQEVLP